VRKFLLFIFILALGALVIMKSELKNNLFGGGYQYVITETGLPNSFDPLDADATQNLPVARMLYLTPLEASGDNQLQSEILESYKYDPATAKVTWMVKRGLTFSDGTEITPQDVAFASIKR
jgi:ABC-type transport system substrate-binding protein